MNRRQKIAIRVAKNIVFLNNCRDYLEFFKSLLFPGALDNRNMTEEAIVFRRVIKTLAKQAKVSIGPLFNTGGPVDPELVEIVEALGQKWLLVRDHKEQAYRFAAYHRNNEEIIKRVGHIVTMVAPGDKKSGFAYSVGRTDRRLPDFLIYPNIIGGSGAGDLINLVASKYDKGEIELNTIYDDSPLITASSGEKTKYRVVKSDPAIVAKTMFGCFGRKGWLDAETCTLQIELANSNNEFE